MRKKIRRSGWRLPIKLAALSAMVALLSTAFPNRAAAQCSIGATTSSGATFSTCPGCTGNGCPGTLLTTYYQTTGSNGDNIINLVNPTGPTSDLLVGLSEYDACAMIYVFDTNENLGECCGCPITAQGLLSLSVEKNLTANWGLSEGAQSSGTIEVVSASEGFAPR